VVNITLQIFASGKLEKGVKFFIIVLKIELIQLNVSKMN